MYLVAILDWYSRYVVSWELDQTLEMSFVLTAMQRALTQAVPEICNSDQGSHFTSPQYRDLLLEANIQISMDGKGRAGQYLDGTLVADRQIRRGVFARLSISTGGTSAVDELFGVLQSPAIVSGLVVSDANRSVFSRRVGWLCCTHQMAGKNALVKEEHVERHTLYSTSGF